MATLRGLIEAHRITASATLVESNPNMTDMPAGSLHWRVRLRFGRRAMTVPFSQGPAITHEPTALDLFDCLLSDASSADESFENWCGDYGLDVDSRKAERTYKAVQKQTAALRRFLNGQFDQFLKADR